MSHSLFLLPMIVRKGKFALNRTCMDPRGLAESALIEGATRSNRTRVAD